MSSEQPARSRGLPDRLRRLRLSLKMTQEALGKAVGVSRLVILSLESGRTKCDSHSFIVKLARVASLSLDDLSAYLSGRVGLRATIARRQSIQRAASPSSAPRSSTCPPSL